MNLNVLMCTTVDRCNNKHIVTYHQQSGHFSLKTDKGISISVGSYYHQDKLMGVKKATDNASFAVACNNAAKYHWVHTAV